MRQHLWVSLIIVASILAGCQSAPAGVGAPGNPPSAQPDQSASPASPTLGLGQPAAYIDGKPVTRASLYRLLVEADGGQVLSELLLDRALDKRLAEQGLSLTEADLTSERERLMLNLSDDEDEAARLLRAMREQRGLGEARYAALIRRNAGLRRLVRDQVVVGEGAIRQAYELRYGKRYRVRLITADRVQVLANARRRALAGESFTDLAIALSTDASAAQGGLLSPVSPADPTYPKAILDALPRLNTDSEAGRLSPIIALPDTHALMRLEAIIQPDAPPISTVRGELERLVRLDLERVRMQQLARVLIEQANVIVLDPALDKAWQRQRGAIDAW